MKLVDNASKWYRMFSIQGLTAISAIQGVLLVLPAEKAKAAIPFTGMTWFDLGVTLTIAAAVITGGGRLIDQGSATEVNPK